MVARLLRNSMLGRQLICGPTSELRTWLLWDLSVEGSPIEFDE
jgi:hypothetical protein